MLNYEEAQSKQIQDMCKQFVQYVNEGQIELQGLAREWYNADVYPYSLTTQESDIILTVRIPAGFTYAADEFNPETTYDWDVTVELNGEMLDAEVEDVKTGDSG
jgi:hypothetical protein